MYYSAQYNSPLGPLILAADDSGHLAGLWMEGQKYCCGVLAGQLTERPDLPIFARVRAWLDDYFAGKAPDPRSVPLAPVGGSPFRKAVWDLLLDIPYGQTTTYGVLAEAMARKEGKASMSAQAVGGAVGHNPISILIPCHRVVGANGSLTGYAGGVDKKVKLLTLEGVDMTKLFVPTKGTAL